MSEELKSQNESYLAYLARCERDGDNPKPMAIQMAREIYMSKRCAAAWLPPGFGGWRAYKGSGWRFLQLWRLRFAVRWAYD